MSDTGTLSWFRAVEQCENQLMKLAYVPLNWLDEVDINTKLEERQFIGLLQEDSYWVGFAGNPWVWTTTGRLEMTILLAINHNGKMQRIIQ